MIVYRCPICQSEDFSLKIDVGPGPSSAYCFTGSENPDGDLLLSMPVFECAHCEYVALRSKAPEYYRSVRRATSVSAQMIKLRKSQAEKVVDLLGSVFKSEGDESAKLRLLEVGAHRGENMQLFGEAGFEVSGLEYHNGCQETFVTHESFKILDQTFDGVDISSELISSFNAVVCFNFLEHFIYPFDGIKNIFKALKPGGIALIEVPNFNYLLECGLISEFISDHQSYFTSRSLSYALLKSGFEIVSIKDEFDNYILSALARKPKKISFDQFQVKESLLGNDFANFFKNKKSDVFFWGAGHQAIYNIIHFNLHPSLAGVIDSSEDKQMSYIDGTGLKIYPPDIIDNFDSEELIICAGGYNREIIASVRERKPSLHMSEIRDGRLIPVGY